MTELDVKSQLIETYKLSMKRGRWFLLIATMLSCLLITTTYIREFGYQRNQLEGIEANRIFNNTPTDSILVANLEKFGNKIDSIKTNNPKDIESINEFRDTIIILSRNLYHRRLTDNTLKTIRIGKRDLPLLGLDVPGDDYPFIVIVMLSVFSIIIALNTRSVSGQIKDILTYYGSNRNIIDILRVNYTFTGLRIDHKKNGDIPDLPRRLEYSAYLLPSIAIAISTTLYLGKPLVEHLFDPRYYMGSWELNAILVGIIVLCFIISLKAGLASKRHSKCSDKLFIDYMDKE